MNIRDFLQETGCAIQWEGRYMHWSDRGKWFVSGERMFLTGYDSEEEAVAKLMEDHDHT